MKDIDEVEGPGGESSGDVTRRRIAFGVVLLAIVAAFIKNVDKVFG